ncbi:MAG: type II secretion system F family protein [Lachnospiraceae bacterium]|nr:type II secretion system F family protein [Lachnospiraceae bacterium]
MKRRRQKGLPAMEVSLFCQQTAMLLKSGIPLYDGMEVLYENYQGTEYKAIFEQLYKSVQQGEMLYESVKEAEIFPDYMVYMLQVGEKTGKLDEVLEMLGDYYEREDKIEASIRSAVVYPLALVTMMAVVVSVLVIKVLPIFTDVFQSLGLELQGVPGIVLACGVILGRAMLAIVLLVLAGALLLYLVWRLSGWGKVITFGSHICPPVGRLLEKKISQHLASALSMVLASGYNMESALEFIPDLLPEDQNIQKVRECKSYMVKDGDFVAAIEKAGLFEPLYLKMIRVGMESGQIEHVMKQIALLYEERVEDGIQDLVSWIEPALVGVLTLVVGGILLSVMLPLLSIMASIG